MSHEVSSIKYARMVVSFIEMGKPEEKQSPGERKEQGETSRWLPGADSSGTRDRSRSLGRAGS